MEEKVNWPAIDKNKAGNSHHAMPMDGIEPNESVEGNNGSNQGSGATPTEEPGDNTPSGSGKETPNQEGSSHHALSMNDKKPKTPKTSLECKCGTIYCKFQLTTYQLEK